jgi:hypothetical protein
MDCRHQLFKGRDVLIRVNECHIGEGSTLPQNTGVFKGHIANPTLDSLQIVSDMPVVDEAILASKMGGHWGHDDPILQFQTSDLERTEEIFKKSHWSTSKRLNH